MNLRSRTWFDHLSVWLLASFFGVFGVGYLVALLTPEPPDAIHDGLTGLTIFPAIGSIYAALAVVQDEYRFVPGWRPSVLQGATVTWVGAWTLLVIVAVLADLASRGLGYAAGTLVWGSVFWGVFVALPWAIARWRHRTTRA